MDKQNILSQEQKEMSSTQNLSTLNQLSQKDLDFNQKSNLKISPVIIKQQEKKNFDTLNEGNSQDVQQVSKEEDIEGIQNKEYSQFDEKELTKNYKYQQITNQMIEEVSMYQILNQENISNAKKDGEDQSNPITLDSDITLKKKIQSSFNRQLAKIGLSQNATFQVVNIKGTQKAIISLDNKEKIICLQYQPAVSNSKNVSKEQIISNQNSQTKTFRKGQQNTPYQMKNERNPSNYEIIQKQGLSNIPQPPNSFKKQQQIFDQNNCLEDQAEQLNDQLGSEKKLSDQLQPDNSALYEDQNKTKQVEIEKQLAITYASQIEKIVNQIKEFKINWNDLDQSKFENINESQIESKAFQDQKEKIISKLNENNFQLRKIVVSNDKQTLVICCQKQFAPGLTDQNKISLIYHNSAQSELDYLNQIFKTLQINFDLIKIEQDNISIFIVQKKDFESLIYEKLKLLTKFKQDIYQINKDYYYYVIDSTHFRLNCKNCENYQCFQNIKARIIAFLQFKKHFYCEHQNTEKEELIFKFSNEEIIKLYIDFVYKLIFRFLENGENEKQQIQKIPEFKQKQINNPQILNEYQFKEYLDQNKLDSNEYKSILNYSQKRQWDISKFIEVNSNELSEMFQTEQNDIIQLLKVKNYYLCKLFISNNNLEDVFIGYQEEEKGVYQDFIFIIKYSPTPSEIQKCLLIQQFNQETIHLIIKNQIHILILSKDVFIQIQNNFEYIKQIKSDWTKEHFEIINKDKIINQKNCNICKECKKNEKCAQYLFFRKFQEYKVNIFENLIKKNYYICEYLSKGGEGLIFQGFSQSIKEKQEVVFKILLDCDEVELLNEIKIMKLFDKNISVIKFIDHIKINSFIHVLILEKCQFSLKDELDQIKLKKIFTLEKLLQMIFNLLDGLIQFRIYNILHLDIKPQNILVTKSGQYVFTDFGMSFLKKDSQKINIKGYTQNYAAPELLNSNENIDYKSDIYSLGKTFKIIIAYFEDIQLQNYKDITSQFKKIINEKMEITLINQRSNCLELSKQFFQATLKQQMCSLFLSLYIPEIKLIQKSYCFDKKKEIPYFLQVKLFYCQNILDFYQSGIMQTDKQISQIQIYDSLTAVGHCYIILGLYKKALECYLDSIQIFRQTFKGDHFDFAYSLNQVGLCYSTLDDQKKALEYYQESLKMFQQIFKQDHPLIATSISNIGTCYEKLGYNKKALEYQLESLKMIKQICKEDDPCIILILNKVGVSYRNLDNKKALEYLLISVQMIKQIIKEDHTITAVYLNNVGQCYGDLGDNKKALEYLLESLKMFQQLFKKYHPYIASSLDTLGSLYQDLGDNKMVLEYLFESLEIRKQIFKEDHPSIALSLNNIGQCYVKLGDNKKALEYLLESLQMRKQIYKEDHPDIATSLNKIGVCYINLDDNKKALEYLLESLQMRKQIFKEDHPDIALSLNNVGQCYKNLGDNKKALEYLLESLQMRKQIFKEDPDIATSLNNVGFCYKNLGDIKMALEYSQESLQIFREIFKEDHNHVAISLANISGCYELLGDNKKALEYGLESLQMRKQIFKEDHLAIASSLNNVGSYYENFGNKKKALEYKLESLKMLQQIFKEAHPDIATSLNNVGLSYQNLGDKKKALEYQLKSLQMRKQILKEDHLDIANSMHNIGLLYKDLGQIKTALEYLLESHKILQQMPKDNRLLILATLNNIGNCYVYLRDIKKALEYKFKSIQMKRQISNEDCPKIAIFLNDVGLFYQSLGDKKIALEYLLESLQVRKQIFKEDHPNIAQSLGNVGLLYLEIGDNKKALEFFLESLQMFKQIFKEDHPDIARSLNKVGLCYQNLGDNKKALEYQLESLQMRKQIFEEDHFIMESLSQVALCYLYIDDEIISLEYEQEVDLYKN